MSQQRVAIIAVIRGEPEIRVRRMLEGCVEQTVRCPVYIAAPGEDAATVAAAAEGLPVVVRHVPNPTGGRSAGLNRAAREAEHQVLCRLDARTQPPVDYVERCVHRLEDPAVGVVGGVQLPVPGGMSRRARAVARALANPYTVGAAPYRVGRNSGVVDTVYLGAFRRDQLLELGGYSEDLDANEDFDLAARYRDRGLLVWLDAGMVHRYEARESVRGVIAQYYTFGRAKAVYWRRAGRRPNARQAVAIAGVSVGLPVLLGSRHRIALALAAVASAALVDHHAASSKESPVVRALAVGIELCLPVSWVAGIYTEALRSIVGQSARGVSLR